MNESKQHVQLPNNMTNSGDLTPKDLLVYVTIKRHLNSITKECFPSLDTIVKESGVSKPTVRKSIESLKSAGYIKVTTRGRSNMYSFNPYKNFEPFSYDFLDLKDLDTNIKAYVMTAQQSMIKDIDGYGKITYSDSELANIVNLDRHTVAKYDKVLEEKGYLSIIKTSKRDEVTGLMIREKLFHLDELGQAVIWKLKNHEDRIEKTESRIEALERQMLMLLKENQDLKTQLDDDKDDDFITL